MKIKVGDNVLVIAGKDKGRTQLCIWVNAPSEPFATPTFFNEISF